MNERLILDQVLTKETFDIVFASEGKRNVERTYRIYSNAYRGSVNEITEYQMEDVEAIGFVYKEIDGEMYRIVRSIIDDRVVHYIKQDEFIMR